MPLSEDGSSLTARALSGTMWTVLRYGVEYSLRLGSNLILTRLLFPEAFGLMALVNALMAGLAMLSDIGIAPSVVQSQQGDDPEFLNTAWTLQVLRGALLWCIAALLAGLMADLYGQEDLRQLIPAAGLTALISGFNSMSLIRLQRHLQIGKLAMIELTSQTLAVAVMVVWALVHPTVWALVGGGVSGSGLKMILSHLILRDQPVRFAWNREWLRQILNFGKWIFVSTMLYFLAGQADRLIFGRILSVSMLGVYSIAIMFALLPTQVLWNIGNLVLFPAFSRRRESVSALDSMYRRTQFPVLVLGALPVACLAACGPELIEILYDPRYADAGWMLQLLAIGSWLQVPQTTSGAVLMALGVPRWIAIGNALKFVGLLALLPLGFLLFGAAGGIAGLAAAETFRYVTFVVGIRRHGLPSLRGDFGLSALVLASTLAGLVAAQMIGRTGSGALLRLFGALGAVLVLWTPAAAVLLRHEISDLWVAIRAARERFHAADRENAAT